MPDTGFHSPTSNGLYNNEWTHPEDAYTSNNSYADPSGNLEQSYELFEIGGTDLIDSIPADARIDGIEVKIEAKADVGEGGTIDVAMNANSDQKQLTWAGDNTEYTKTYGGSTDKWGRSWVRSDFANATFWLYARSENTGQNYIDHIQVKVYYTEYLIDNKSVNGVAKASIKSINSILAGNIKTVN